MMCRFKSVTNGIHVRSWLSTENASMLDRYLGEGWSDHPADQASLGRRVSQIPDEEVWRAHERCRERLIAWTRQTLREQLDPPRREL